MYTGSYHAQIGQRPFYPGFLNGEVSPAGYVFPPYTTGYQNPEMMEQRRNTPANWGPLFTPPRAPFFPNQKVDRWNSGMSQSEFGQVRPPMYQNQGPRGPCPLQNDFGNRHGPKIASHRRDANNCNGHFLNRGHNGNSRVKAFGTANNNPSSINEPSSSSGSSTGVIRCEPCEKNFNSLRDLQCHEKTHVQCEAEGCEFIASRKMVNLHHIQNHAEGKFRIRLFTDEDIEKWREERRRNYPTLSNVKKKVGVDEKRRATGAVLGSTEFKYVEQMNSRRNTRRKHNGGFKRVYKSANPAQVTCEKTVNSDVKGSGVNCGDVHASNCRPEEISVNVNEPSEDMPSEKNGIPNALQAIGMTYSSDEGESPSDSKDKGNDRNDDNLPYKKINGHDTSLSDANGPPKSVDRWQSRNVRDPRRKSKNTWEDLPTPQAKRRPTLLEMLLANDIRKERNIILQCVRHVVGNNFFDPE